MLHWRKWIYLEIWCADVNIGVEILTPIWNVIVELWVVHAPFFPWTLCLCFRHRALITRRLILMIRPTGAAVSQLGVPFSITSCQDAFVSLWNNCLSSCQSDWLIHKKGCSLPAHRAVARRNCNLLNWRFDSSIPDVNVHFSSFTWSAFWCMMCKIGPRLWENSQSAWLDCLIESETNGEFN